MNGHVVNAGLVVVSVLVVLAGVEAALAVGVVEGHQNLDWSEERQLQPCKSHNDATSMPYPHPEYGWTAPPRTIYYEKTTPAQEWERHEINDEGFRDTYDTGDQGVVVLGDSFTHGTLASNNETYPYLLDRWNPDVTVHNYGMLAYGPQQYYLVYRDRAEEVDHDLVVVGYYLDNELKESVSTNPAARPLFDVSDGELRQVREPQQEIDRGSTGDFSRERALTVTMALLDGIGQVAAENDAEVLVMTIPHEREVGSGAIPDYAEQREAIDQLADEESNVHTLHTRPILDGEQRKGNRVYGVYDLHLDDYGHYVLARGLQSWMVENDDQTGLAVTPETRGPTPDQGIFSRVAGKLRYHTESYDFLATRTRLLAYEGEQRLGLDDEVNPCE